MSSTLPYYSPRDLYNYVLIKNGSDVEERLVLPDEQLFSAICSSVFPRA